MPKCAICKEYYHYGDHIEPPETCWCRNETPDLETVKDYFNWFRFCIGRLLFIIAGKCTEVKR